MRQKLLSAAAATFVMAASCHSSPTPPITTPGAAIAIAKSGWAGAYDKTHYSPWGEQDVAKFEPYTATLKDGEWIVKGTIPLGYHGLTPTAKVRASDGFGRVSAVEIQ